MNGKYDTQPELLIKIIDHKDRQIAVLRSRIVNLVKDMEAQAQAWSRFLGSLKPHEILSREKYLLLMELLDKHDYELRMHFEIYGNRYGMASIAESHDESSALAKSWLNVIEFLDMSDE